ncbi:hypothetical protein [Paraferrimonas sp. SM1919]|uniref:hypothetical protein n=1 Tax=Paraferrimonas sp. SM1919 TaxID=2662263 RepID=UPI0013D68CC9|nr:hypothetical protein [Paraferrimonas sp. SM1919]
MFERELFCQLMSHPNGDFDEAGHSLFGDSESVEPITFTWDEYSISAYVNRDGNKLTYGCDYEISLGEDEYGYLELSRDDEGNESISTQGLAENERILATFIEGHLYGFVLFTAKYAYQFVKQEGLIFPVLKEKKPLDEVKTVAPLTQVMVNQQFSNLLTHPSSKLAMSDNSQVKQLVIPSDDYVLNAELVFTKADNALRNDFDYQLYGQKLGIHVGSAYTKSNHEIALCCATTVKVSNMSHGELNVIINHHGPDMMSFEYDRDAFEFDSGEYPVPVLTDKVYKKTIYDDIKYDENGEPYIEPEAK